MSKGRILVVEDEAVVAADLQQRLTALGYEVTGTAASGREALRLAEAQPPDLALMDIKLEGELDGIQAASRLAELFRVPVVYLTAFSDRAFLERAKITEPYGYLLKPFSERELGVWVEIAIYKSQADQERERLRHELEQALAEIKTLRGMLPICAWCHKIRDDRGAWENIEVYLMRHTATQVTHSICPECLSKETSELQSPLAD